MDDHQVAKLFGEALALRTALAQLCCRFARLFPERDQVVGLWYRDVKSSVAAAEILADSKVEADEIRRHAENVVDDLFLSVLGAHEGSMSDAGDRGDQQDS